MNFGQAVEELNNGKKLSRKGWGGNGLHIYLDHGSRLVMNGDHLVDLHTSTGEIVPCPIIQHDMLADDWRIVD